MEHFDVIVIGGGSAGYAAARTVRETHQRVAIVDNSDELGGLCILRGCMPSKTLIYSAEVLHLAQNGRLFGLDIPSAKVDMPALHQRKTRMIDDFKSYRQEQLASDRFTLFRELGAFKDPKTLKLSTSGKEITADAFIIATGSVVNFPNIPGLELPGIWTSDDVLDLSELPESVIVLGGGVVACELAQFLHRAGSKVTQVQRSPHILKEESPEAAEVVMKAFREEGMDLHTGTKLGKIEKTDTGFSVEFMEGAESMRVEARHLVNALGRRPAIDNMNLKAAGVTLKPNGQIQVNEHQQTSNPKIYAAGDVCGPFEIVHIAIMQGETAARHATGRPADPVNLDTRTSVVFTDPQVASAGIPVEEAKARGMELIEAEYPFDDHGKSILMEAKHGYVKAWAERSSGRIVGAQCVGKDAGELIHALAVGISMGATAKDLLKVHWYHPTLSEIWSYPLEDIADGVS
ncbi:NAD(P)/FAD-dependent oxidoreductase [Puniceicoccales bacterium CK1056]|uniref:NAD(P)/FAD-dependent oxidoreductase n=1 Tax=Oceanipulchritudo coccoides TaxID=2706888 RepID=A0A6B2M0I4_9BACT|nr:NAD(P)/FAD-dependent oxidoreductase [Oceanipulchritudo coccoides]NDV61819.1 NAD(P)/FAD-dependent oxidoreductase [Oceanipulchritudo coccoides]